MIKKWLNDDIIFIHFYILKLGLGLVKEWFKIQKYLNVSKIVKT